MNPSYKEALLSSGQIYVSLDQPSRALIPLQKALILDPDDAEAHFLLGTALIRLGRNTEGAHERQICGRIRAAERAKSPH